MTNVYSIEKLDRGPSLKAPPFTLLRALLSRYPLPLPCYFYPISNFFLHFFVPFVRIEPLLASVAMIRVRRHQLSLSLRSNTRNTRSLPREELGFRFKVPSTNERGSIG